MQTGSYTVPMRLAELVKEKREALGWNKSKLAREARVDPSTITRIENGEMLGHSDTIARIGNALGIDPRKLDAAIRDQESEENETQYVDLAGLSPEARERTKRMIDAIVREAKREEEAMRKRKPAPGSKEYNQGE